MMKHALAATILGLTLATPAMAQTGGGQAPGLQQMLGGLLTGNQNQDNAVREAYQRGYQRGSNDEARRLGAYNRQNSQGSGYYQGGYNGGRGSYAPPNGNDNGYYNG